MEKINLNYSQKNIPIPPKKSYQLELISKIESVIKRMRWRAHFFLNVNKNNDNETKTETFGFKSKHHPGQSKELENFEKDLFNIATSLKFRTLKNSFKENRSGILAISQLQFVQTDDVILGSSIPVEGR